jgi:hypothetical protein
VKSLQSPLHATGKEFIAGGDSEFIARILHLLLDNRMHDGFLVISSKVMDANNINQEKNKGHITSVLSSTKRFQK